MAIHCLRNVLVRSLIDTLWCAICLERSFVKPFLPGNCQPLQLDHLLFNQKTLCHMLSPFRTTGHFKKGK